MSNFPPSPFHKARTNDVRALRQWLKGDASIETDVSSLDHVDAGIRVSDLTLPDGVTAVVDPEELVVKLAARRVSAAEEEEEAAGEAAEAAPEGTESAGEGSEGERE